MRALALLAALLPAACRPAQPPAQAPPQASAPVAEAAGEATASPPPREQTARRPNLRIDTLDGARYDLAAHRGKWVVLNFWATWCGPCLKEMPELSALDAKRGDIDVLGLAYEDIEPAAMRAFLKQHPVAYPVALLDVYQPLPDFAAPRGLPVTYLVGPDGAVAKEYLGPVTAAQLEGDIAKAGGRKPGAA